MGSVMLVRRVCALLLAVAPCALAVVAAASAGAAQTGTLVVRLVTDPAPPGAAWTYAGAGPPFTLDTSPGEHSVVLPAGTYRLAEAPSRPGQPASLTALSCRDPGRDTTTSLATATADVALGDGETVECTFTHRALGRRSAAATVALAAEYAPVLRLGAGEPYRPLALEAYLSLAELHGGAPPGGPLLQQHPTVFSLPATTEPTYLDVAGADPSSPAAYRALEQRLAAASPRPTVYWHVVRQRSTGRTAIEYWLLYLYNDFYDRHEADWEQVTVFLDGTEPLGVATTAHEERRWAAWQGWRHQGTHPVVYVARGSHAGYARPGRYGVRVCWRLLGIRCTNAPRVDVASGTGPVLAPSAYDLRELGGVGYGGNWSSGTLVLGIGRTSDRIVDPRRRSLTTNPFTILPG